MKKTQKWMISSIAMVVSPKWLMIMDPQLSTLLPDKEIYQSYRQFGRNGSLPLGRKTIMDEQLYMKVIWVVEFPREGYKIRKGFFLAKNQYSHKEIIVFCENDVVVSCQKSAKSDFQSQFSMSKK
jgi:hypothetical protein